MQRRYGQDKMGIWSDVVKKISECGLRIADFQCTICLIFQSAIRNLKSAIHFTPILLRVFAEILCLNQMR